MAAVCLLPSLISFLLRAHKAVQTRRTSRLKWRCCRPTEVWNFVLVVISVRLDGLVSLWQIVIHDIVWCKRDVRLRWPTWYEVLTLFTYTHYSFHLCPLSAMTFCVFTLLFWHAGFISVSRDWPKRWDIKCISSASSSIQVHFCSSSPFHSTPTLMAVEQPRLGSCQCLTEGCMHPWLWHDKSVTPRNKSAIFPLETD